MEKFGKRFFLPTILLILLFGLTLPSSDAVVQDRHINPSEIQKVSPVVEQISSLYAEGLSFAAIGDWSSSFETIRLAVKAYVSPDLKPLMSELKRSGHNLVRDLREVEQNLENARGYRVNAQFEEGRQELTEAKTSLAKARRSEEDVAANLQELSEELGTLPPIVGMSISEVDELIESYKWQIENELRAIERRQKIENQMSIPPRLSVKVPKRVFPGENMRIEGSVTRGGIPVVDHSVSVEWNNQIWKVRTGENGEFSINIKISLDILPGPHSVKTLIVVKEGGKVGLDKVVKTVVVARRRTEILMEDVGFGFSGGTVELEGRLLTEDIPSGDSKITIGFGEERVNVPVSENGHFKASLNVPLLTMSGHHKFVVVSGLEDPRFKPSRTLEEVLILNPLTILLASLSIAGVTVWGWKRSKRSAFEPKKVRERKIEEETEVETERELTGITGLFLKAVRAVTNLTGIGLKPQHTIREYLERVKDGLGRAYGPFEDLSLSFERWLYGGAEEGPDESLLDRLLKRIGVKK